MRDLRRFVEELPRYPGCYVVHPYGGVPAGRVTLTAWGRILATLEVRDRTQAVIFAYNAGIIQPDSGSR